MNEIFVKLATQNFYANADSMRSFFMLSTKDIEAKEEAFFGGQIEESKIISYGDTHNTITISGMMLREKSIITKLGWATSTEQVIEHINETLSEGKKVKLVMNTGGGLVSGTSNLAEVIYENRDNIEAYATGMVASAGMWVFSSAGKRYAEDTTVMGSIGVVTSVLDDEEYWKNYGIVWKEIVSENAKNKRPDVKTQAGQDEVKRYLTSLESIFLDSVSKYLSMSKEDIISNFHQGGLITGADALDLNVIESLTGYNNKLVASMPTVLNADKIANQTKKETVMEITQEQLDAVQAQLDDAISANSTLQANLDKANDAIAGHEKALDDVKADTLKVCAEIVGMSMEYAVDKDTAIAMVSCGDINESAKIAMDSKKVGANTVQSGDIDEGASKEKDDEAEELAYAQELARKLSV